MDVSREKEEFGRGFYKFNVYKFGQKRRFKVICMDVVMQALDSHSRKPN